MQAIRKLAEKEQAKADNGEHHHNIEEAWLECLEPMINMIKERFERLLLKGERVKYAFKLKIFSVYNFDIYDLVFEVLHFIYFTLYFIG